MSRTLDAAEARLRLMLAIMVGGAVAVLTPALFATQVDAPSAILLTAVAVAVAAVVGLSRRVATLAVRALSQPRAADEAPPILAGRVTDPVHHPLRPRAPGLA